jgi:hypothetical protein
MLMEGLVFCCFTLSLPLLESYVYFLLNLLIHLDGDVSEQVCIQVLCGELHWRFYAVSDTCSCM